MKKIDIDSRKAEIEIIFRKNIKILLNFLISFFILQVFTRNLTAACSVLSGVIKWVSDFEKLFTIPVTYIQLNT